jgi:hypothetical protein
VLRDHPTGRPYSSRSTYYVSSAPDWFHLPAAGQPCTTTWLGRSCVFCISAYGWRPAAIDSPTAGSTSSFPYTLCFRLSCCRICGRLACTAPLRRGTRNLGPSDDHNYSAPLATGGTDWCLRMEILAVVGFVAAWHAQRRRGEVFGISDRRTTTIIRLRISSREKRGT